MRRAPLLILLASIAVLAMLAPASPREAPAPGAAADAHAIVRGMTISCPGAGRIWASDAMVETMARLETMGVNWVAIHPYAGIGSDGTVGASRMDRMYADTTWLTRPIAEAHRLGLKIMIKPHLAYWGSPFSWRGAISFETEAQWSRFFETYRAWIVRIAEICADADAFVVGTELDRTIDRAEAWHGIIEAVRGATDAPLTYAANWDSFERVPFWDALDVIAVQAYFPLAVEGQPVTQADLHRAWADVTDRLEQFGRAHDRRVLLSELGYDRTPHAAVRPWEPGRRHDDRTAGEALQRDCMAAALQAVERSEVVVGAFLWKWFPGERARSNYIMSTPAMREVISEHWTR